LEYRRAALAQAINDFIAINRMPMQLQTEAQISTQEPQSPLATSEHARPRRGWLTAVVIVAVFAGVLVSGILQRIHTSAALRTETDEMAVPTISVVSPQRAAPSQEIVLPGNVQPYVTAPIFSRTNGYLRAWYFDIGAHVKKGQLLAVIATPEVDQQLGQSRSNLSTAEANLRLAEITKDRYKGLLKTHAVSQQDVDNADVGRRRAASDQAVAAYDQAVANYRQTVLTGFQQVEDNVAALRILEHEARVQDQAVAAAQKYLELAITRYKGGVTSYLEVTTAQGAALSDEVTAVNILGRRMLDAVTLVQALGGGWNSSELPQRPECCGKLTSTSR
jgi:multidrug efflux pump subunit AcrA (membrane-fusion protein)